MTKKEPKSDARLSEFDWHDLSLIFLAIMFLHEVDDFLQKTNENNSHSSKNEFIRSFFGGNR